MNSRILTYIAGMSLFAALAVAAGLQAQEKSAQGQQLQVVGPPQQYAVTDLGTLGGTFSLAERGINNKGWVSGISNLTGDQEQHAFLWQTGVMTDLGTLGGPNSGAWFPLNERGQVVGFAETPVPDPFGEDFCGFGTHLICLPFTWQNGLITSLPTLGGNNGFATEINNGGEVVGGAENGASDPTCLPPEVVQFKPVFWENGKIQELPTFPGDPDGEALAINDTGQAVGDSGICDIGPGSSALHAVLWQDSKVTDLGNLGGTRNHIALDINNQGQVVGTSDLPGDGTGHAFLWARDQGMRDLGTLPGDIYSEGDSINEGDQVVGYSCDKSGNCRAFLWQNGAMADLNALLPPDSPLYLLYALGINSSGQIGGGAIEKSTGEIHAFLATPCEGDHAATLGCDNRAEGTTGAHAGAREVPKVAIPENLRKQLRCRLGFRGLGARLETSQ